MRARSKNKFYLLSPTFCYIILGAFSVSMIGMIISIIVSFYDKNAVNISIIFGIAAFLSGGFLAAHYFSLRRQLNIMADSIKEANVRLGLTENISPPKKKAGLFQVNNLEEIFEQHNRTLEKLYAAELLSKQAEFEALQNQINPHFLYNALDSIRGEATTLGADNIARMTLSLSRFFRYNISKKGNFVTIEEELNNIRDYFIIQEFRFGNRFRLVIENEDASAINHLYIPKLTLQPLVENSIHHGLEMKNGDGTVLIRVQMLKNHVILLVQDDGIGMSLEQLQSVQEKINKGMELNDSRGSNGIALHNVNQRLRMFFGEECGLHLASTEGVGTEAELFFPITTTPPVV